MQHNGTIPTILPCMSPKRASKCSFGETRKHNCRYIECPAADCPSSCDDKCVFLCFFYFKLLISSIVILKIEQNQSRERLRYPELLTILKISETVHRMNEYHPRK